MHTFLWYPGPPTDQGFKSSNNMKSNDSSSSNINNNNSNNNSKNKHDCCCCCSLAKSCLTCCNPMDCSAPGFPILHYLLEFAQTHVH